jgi:outer membrane receptor protein involved in Fe transport
MNLTVKHGLSILMFCFFSLAAFAQAPGTHSIKGTVVDSLSKKTLDFVTVALKTSDNRPFRTLLTDSNGEFLFSKIAPGKYKLTIVSVGYKTTARDTEVDSTKAVMDAGTIPLATASNQLKEVSVTAEKPLIKQEIDRIAYDVQTDPESKVNNVLDMLRKVPLVTVDGDDNIQVKGSSSFKVLINGRPSSLIARSPKDVFKSMPASNIQKIEVITTPPAKYDGEGLAGIINIITNKKIDEGYNGSVGIRYRFPWGPNLNGQLTVKGKKFGLSAFVGGNYRDIPGTSFSLVREGLGSGSASSNTSGNRKQTGKYTYSNAELSYEIDTLNLLTAEIGFNYGDGRNTNLQSLSNSFNFNTTSYNIDNPTEYNWKGVDLGINYQLGFKRNKEQLLTGSYKFNRGTDYNSSDYFTKDFSSSDANAKASNYGQNNESGTNEQTIQLDYIHPIKKINIEGGLKIILRDNFSDYEYGTYSADSKESTYTIDDTKSNEFNYRQNVFSFYNSYQLKLKDWGFKAGLRIERTVIDANFVSLGTPLNTDYENFIPSVSVQKKFKKNSSINLGYTQRIQRPNIWQLNPYVEQFNENFTSSGNKDLKPVLNHNFDLNYSVFKKGTINAGLSYSFANNTIQYVSRLDGNVGRSTFENIGKNKSAGFNINTNKDITKNFNINVNGGLSYVWMEGVIDDNVVKNGGAQGNLHASAAYKFKKDLKVVLNGGYNSPWLTLQGESNPYYYTSTSVSKEFFNKKASFSVYVANPFQKYRNWKNETSSLQFIQMETFQNYYRNYGFNLSYKFGKLNGSIKKNQRGIQNDDVAGKSGGN